MRGRLLELAEDAIQPGWWEDYADALAPAYKEFIGLEAEAVSSLQWQADGIPGLLQTEDYARQIGIAYKTVVPTIPPSVLERSLRVRMLRQERLVHEPVLRLCVILDEAVLLRRVGDRAIMHAQLARLVEAAELPNVDVRVLPLSQNIGLIAGSFVIMSFGEQGTVEAPGLADVVSTESLNAELYVEGETDTYLYRLFFQRLQDGALSPVQSRQFIVSAMERAWS